MEDRGTCPNSHLEPFVGTGREMHGNCIEKRGEGREEGWEKRNFDGITLSEKKEGEREEAPLSLPFPARVGGKSIRTADFIPPIVTWAS